MDLEPTPDALHLSPQDRQDISDLNAKYTIAYDTLDYDLLEELFDEHVTMDYPGFGSPSTVHEIQEFVRSGLGGLTSSQHFLGQSLITPTASGASGRTYFQAQHVRQDTPGGDLYMIAGWYDDSFVKTDGRWVFSSKRLTYAWDQGNKSVFDHNGIPARRLNNPAA
jgi:hypothetical protein